MGARVRQSKVGKSDFIGRLNRNAVASFSPTLPLRLRWEGKGILDHPTARRLCPRPMMPVTGPQPFQGWNDHHHRDPKVAAAATLGWRM